MQEEAELKDEALQQLEQALQRRLDRLEASVGAKLQAQLVTLARLIGETAAATPAPPAGRPATPVPGPRGVAGTAAEACHIDLDRADGVTGGKEYGR